MLRERLRRILSLVAAGGSRLDDFARMQSDRGLKELGLLMPSSESARFFLYAFHEEDLLKDRPEKGAFIPPETEPLKNLLKVQEHIITRTHDEDASVVESAKEEARPTYLGHPGCRAAINCRAETSSETATSLQHAISSLTRSIEMLPDAVAEARCRADSASYNHDLMDALKPGLTINGRRIKVVFAVSADMSESLGSAIEELPEEAWKPLRKVADKGLIAGRKERAEAVFVPSKTNEKKSDAPDRHLAIRARPSQGELFSDGNAYRHYAAGANNRVWDGGGAVEKVFDVLKNDLGAGATPCAKILCQRCLAEA